jgi:hypothetical protein
MVRAMSERAKVGATYHGMVPDDHPIYRGGWNFVASANMRPSTSKASGGDDPHLKGTNDDGQDRQEEPR